MRFDKFQGNDWLTEVRADFDAAALRLYRYQSEHQELYRAFHEALSKDPNTVQSIDQIPFLPISFFKTHRILCGDTSDYDVLFESSGTTGMVPSRHYVRNVGWYEQICLEGFQQFYGGPGDWVILGLLPSYLERSSSSLVHMARKLMLESAAPENGFYLSEFENLSKVLQRLRVQGKKVLLLGVTFALLDFAEAYPMCLDHVVVMETGGMKGRREEWTRDQVHAFLQQQWQLKAIHSEYGMTELLSQAYAAAQGFFRPIDTMKVLVRDLQDPLDTRMEGIGALNIIDLANVNSCAFIATEDIGRLYADTSFEVLGRMDFAALRGCSLMAIH